MGYETIRVTRLSPHLGAEIGDIDLTQPLSNRQVHDLHEALTENLVIFFRDQPIDFAAHRALARHFGELHIHVGGDGTSSKNSADHPEIRVQHFVETSTRVSGE
jgi:taurine dioxygenase